MPYPYAGDHYRRGDYYRGDYYRGDPFLGKLFKKIGGAVVGAAKGFITGGPVGALGGAAGALVPATPKPFPTFPTSLPTMGFPFTPSAGIRPRPGVVVNGGPYGPPLPDEGGYTPGAHWTGTRWVRKRRRMNVTNPRALRRALRRAQGFAKLARRFITVSSRFKKGKRRKR